MSSGPWPYFDDFFEPPRDDDLRADDFEDFFAPLLEVERDVLDFFAPDLALDRFVEDFLVAGDFAICGCPFVPLQKGHGNRISRRGEETTKRPLQSNRMENFLMFIH